MKVKELLGQLAYSFLDLSGQPVTDEKLINGFLDRDIAEITNDSRKAAAGTLFFCISGARSDGHDFACAALRQGAEAIVIEKIPEAGFGSDLTDACGDRVPVIVRVENSRYAMAFISAAFYGHPAEEMKIIGITGTKGKTTTTYMIRDMLEHAGYETGLIGTIETAYKEVRIPSENTTPESIVLQKRFREMADAGVQVVVMEVSSQALMLHRTQGFRFDIGIFTNLTPDHIGENEHSSFENYLYCKSLLFRQCETGIINGDDPHAEEILKDHTCSVETYGIGSGNDLYAVNAKLTDRPGELGIAFSCRGSSDMDVEIPLPGKFSIYNALSAIACCMHFRVPEEKMQEALRQMRVKGRIEMIDVSDSFTLLIDYSHNAVSLESILTTLREYHPSRLVCLFGCGGDRSRLRRFEMGEVSGKLADLTIMTSDNPRTEDPMAIIADIRTGIQKTQGAYVEIPDRKEAIRYAIRNAQPGDVVVLAGKGHEDYQEINGKKYPMDERILIREILEEQV